MPIFEYICKKNSHRFEKIVSVYSPDDTKCPKCGSSSEIVWSVPAKRDPNEGIQR